MKKLRFIGLLVTVVLLAFGLALGCSSGGSDDDDNPADLRTSTYEGTASGQKVEITFSNATIQARARAISEPPQSGDYYVIKVAGTETSRGTISVGANNVIIFNPTSPAGQAPFQGSLTNGVLAVSGVPSPTGAALSVTATVPGSAAGGVGGGGGTGSGAQPGGSGGGGSSYTETPKVVKPAEASLITYVITQDGANTGTTTTTLTLTFSSPLDNLTSSNIVIENGTGKAEIADYQKNATGNVYTIALKGQAAGNVTVSIKDKANVDPTPKTVPIYNTIDWTDTPQADQTGTITLNLADATASTTAHYFRAEVNQLRIAVTAKLKELTMDNIGWNVLIDNNAGATPNLTGLKADIEVTNLVRSSDVLYLAEVKVNKQGPVEFFLQGTAPIAISGTPPNEVIEVKPLNPTPTTVLHATNISKIDYGVTRATGDSGGQRSFATTSELRVEFEYDPVTAGATLTNQFAIATHDDVGNWEAGTGVLAVDNNVPDKTVYKLVSDTPLKTKQGFVDFTITGVTGITGAAKTVEVFRKPKITYTATTVETAGITTYVMLTFSRNFSPEDQTNYDANSSTTGFNVEKVAIKDSRGEWIAKPDDTNIKGQAPVGNTGDNANVPFTASDTDIPRQLIRLAYPISRDSQGRGTVQLFAAQVGDDIEDGPVPVQLRHGGYVQFEAAGTAVSATEVNLSFTLNESIADVINSAFTQTINLVKVLPSNEKTVITAVNVGTTHNLTGTTTAWVSPSGGLPGASAWTRASNANGAETTTVTVRIGRPTAVNYGNFFFDPERDYIITVTLPAAP